MYVSYNLAILLRCHIEGKHGYVYKDAYLLKDPLAAIVPNSEKKKKIGSPPFSQGG